MTSEHTYQVLHYNIDNLKKLLTAHSDACAEDILNKSQIAYFEEYFDEIDAQTIIVESHYIDRDFLVDFAGYYVRCFHPYQSKCTRLHFWDNKFDKKIFDSILMSGKLPNWMNPENKEYSYLGFIVVKHLPETIIGRTCLKTYPDREFKRYFPIKQTYEANLYGIPLRVDTLAFQEQDKTVSACATSALWSAFQGTGRLFNHPIPSPFEITKIATEFTVAQRRRFPNKGLNGIEIARAIQSLGLEPHFETDTNAELLKCTIYAYLKMGIPVIMGHQLLEIYPKIQDMGHHGIAITGYRMEHDELIPMGSDFLIESSRISKIYAHDDQVGPFARMEFLSDFVDFKNLQMTPMNIASLSKTRKYAQTKLGEIPKKLIEEIKKKHGDNKPFLSTSHSNRGKRKVIAIPDFIVIPLYNKIRIPFSDIHELAMNLDGFFKKIGEILARKGQKENLFSQTLKWDIYLTTVNSLKKSLFNDNVLIEENKHTILTMPLPAYVWRVIARDRSVEKKFELLLDATEIQQGDILVTPIWYDTAYQSHITAIPSERVDQIKGGMARKVFSNSTNLSKNVNARFGPQTVWLFLNFH